MPEPTLVFPPSSSILIKSLSQSRENIETGEYKYNCYGHINTKLGDTNTAGGDISKIIQIQRHKYWNLNNINTFTEIQGSLNSDATRALYE